VEKPYGRGLTLVGWCVAAAGIALILISTLASDNLLVPLQIGGLLLFALGSAGFVLGQRRS
jgi:hypothetical protein